MMGSRATVSPEQKQGIWKGICLSFRGKSVLAISFLHFRDGSRSMQHLQILPQVAFVPLSANAPSLEKPKYLKTKQIPPKYTGSSK